MQGAHWSMFSNVHPWRVQRGNPSRAAAGSLWWERGKILSGNPWAWNGPLEQHQANPGLDLRKQSGPRSGALHPGLLQRLNARLRPPEAHHLSTASPRARGGNLGGAEHAVQNNLGGGIFFLLGSVKSLIYGFHSGPGLQIIPLSKQANS